MKKMLSYFNRVLCALVLCASLVSFGSPVSSYSEGVSNATNEPLVNSFSGVTITLSHRKLTYFAVEFYGKAILAENYSADSFGIVYSKDRNFTTSDASFLTIDELYGTSFTVSRTYLEPGTTYYYASYIKKGSLYKYSTVKSFTTRLLLAPILYSVSHITEGSALINGKVLPPLDKSSSFEYGIEYSKDSYFTYPVTRKEITDIYSENKFSLSITSIDPGTVYYYRSYIKMNGVYVYSDIKSFTTAKLVAPNLADVMDITEVSAIIDGTIIPPSVTNYALEYGLQCSTTSDFSLGVNSKKITDIDSENKFSISVSSLVPSTRYFYRSFIKMNSVYCYGDIKSFTTASLIAPSLNEVKDVKVTSATINGIIIPASRMSPALEYGLQYSTSLNFSSGITSKKVTDIDSENNFSISIASLMPATSYYYRSYIKMNGVYVYGDIKSFTTKGIRPIVPSGYTNLSAVAPANCYIISQSGRYSFLVTRGNSPSNLLHSTKSASVLWESFGTSRTPNVGDLIKSVSYKDGYIAFKTADSFKEGNAVIAAKDANGTILWSWHIWFTDKPQGQKYNNKAGTMMDRNLGATSANPGDDGALGLLYQWGRKDPFLGYCYIFSTNRAKSTIQWPYHVESNSSTGTIAYATANPTTFIECNWKNRDWYYTGSSSTDKTRWATVKSIYDPCPAGWRVATTGWANVVFTCFDYTFDTTNKGMNFSDKFGTAFTIWYPASGYLALSGRLDDIGCRGCYWGVVQSVSIFPDRVVCFPVCDRASGQSVRCIKE